MNFTFSEEQEKFREEIRDFCQSEPYGEIDARVYSDFSPEFYRRMAAKGWIGLVIPKEYGSRGRGWIEGIIFAGEMAFHRAPMALASLVGSFSLGRANLLKHGSEQHKRYYLPRTARGEIWIGQSFSEASGGSM